MNDRHFDAGVLAQMSDAQLVGRVIGGDHDCYRFLVQRHQDSMFRVAYALVLDDDVAADIVQDAFVRAYVSLARCRDRSRFRVWLLATLRNRGLDYLKEKRRGDLSLDVDGVTRRAEAMGAHTGAEDERHALRTALEDAIARLSDPLREAFLLRHVEQLSVEETAAVLGTGTSAVKMRVHRAREQLKEWLADDENDHERSGGIDMPDTAGQDVTGDGLRSSW
ncbi:MAG: sigma-70 family RNA polymerase sigma factor [Gemmatimonadetes bacterium]|nr:sigma-70 family RNA polymerase sigma factor [Gemmatimonadota bacterium]